MTQRTHNLLFVPENDRFPDYGIITSTARRGDKWFKQACVGDALHLLTEHPEPAGMFSNGRAIVLDVQLVSLWEVLKRAHENHVIQGHPTNPQNESTRAEMLLQSVKMAYGVPLSLAENFTLLKFVRIREE